MPSDAVPTSTYATSGGRSTGPYSEALALARYFAAAWPDAVQLLPFGTTSEGREMLALAIGRGDLKAPSRPVLFLQAGIHPGEIEGKDAGFRVLERLLRGEVLSGALERLTLIFVPVLNADGHERSSPNNRPNQRGPSSMGWRTTAQNLNLNRDYTKVDAPEMAAVLRLMQAWEPVLFCDIHATDGAQFVHDVSLLIDAAAVGAGALLAQGQQLQADLLADLTRRGHTPVAFYPSLRSTDDPASGFDLWVLSPRYSNGYWGAMRERLSVLVETHSWRPYAHRVETVEHILHALIDLGLRHGADWLAAAAAADSAAAKLAGREVALSFVASKNARLIDFQGYAYTRTLSPVSGRLRTTYDERTPQIWRVPLYDDLVPDVQVRAPQGGYYVPPSYAALLGPRLEAHGITFQVLDQGVASASTWTFRAATFSFASASFEGRTRLSVEGSWQEEARPLLRGGLFVPIAQARARLVLHLFEPQAPDSFLAWGFFNGHFERKEHMEEYVTEAVAAAMLADPAVRAEFERELSTNERFAASGSERLDWFYRRHPAWDERYALVPIYRLERSYSQH